MCVTSIGDHTELPDFEQGSAGALETLEAVGCFTRDVKMPIASDFHPAAVQQGRHTPSSYPG